MADRSVVYRLKADVTNLKAGVAQASASFKKLGDDITGAEKSSIRHRQALSDLGDTAGKAGLAAAAGLGATVKAAMDWESAWAGVTKTVDGSASEMAELEDGLRNLAKTMPATHDEIAGVAEAAGQLGVAREDIVSFTRTMIDLGETTNLTAEDAATGIAQISNVMGTAGDDVDNFGSALVALGNDGASTEAQILEMAQRIAGAGAQIGLAESDILAIANAAASMGIEAEAGGSSISKVFTEMAKAVATEGPKLEQFAQAAGVSGEEFARAFGEDPAQAFALFTGGLDAINKSGGDVFTVLDDLGMADIRVSQSLLSMAASGDLLTDSLRLGEEAWEDNTALAIEAAKRYDTAASQMQVSWNNIKDAGIDAGEAMLPVVESVAGVVSDLAQAFGDLPQPVKNATGPLLGLTAIFGGGLWFTAKTINGIAGMRQSLADLGDTGGKAAGVMGKMGRAATLAGAAIAGLAIIDSIQSKTDDAAVGMEEMTRSLLGMGDLGVPKGLDDLAASIERLSDPNAAQALQDNISDAIGGIGGGSELKNARADIEGLDAALANLANTAGIEASEKAFEDLTRAAGLSIEEQMALGDLMPQYREAIAGIQNETAKQAAEAKGAAGATDQLGGAMAGAGASMRDAAKEAERLKQKFESLNAVLEGRAGLRDYEAALDDFTASIKKNGNTFDITTGKGRENQAALDAIAQSALDVAENMGQADRKKFLTGAIADIRTMGERMGLPKDQIRDLIRLLERANRSDVKPEVKPQGLDKAMEDLYRLDRLKIGDKTFTIHTQRVDDGEVDYLSGGAPRIKRAAGGPVFGPGTATSDSIPALLSNGEHVWTAREVANAGGHAAIMAMRSQFRFAQGGAVGVSVPAAPAGASIDYDRLAGAMLRARPMYGDVHISGDPSEWKRQQMIDRQTAGMDGVRRP